MRGVTGARPLGLDEAEALIAAPGAGHGGPLLIALSGGPDSSALAGLCAMIARRREKGMFIAATVDHGLRPGSQAEAEAAGAFARSLGLDHTILHWSGPKPASGVQAAAREARYRLLADLARQRGAAAILTAHTLDDQAETMLMRLAGGSGLRGLAGMAATIATNGVTLVRPLLAIPKARLVATCEAEGWPFVHDPSNSNPAFLRARLRSLQPALEAEGLTQARLARLANRLRRAEEALSVAAAMLRQNASGAGPGLDARQLAEAPEELTLRVFEALVDEASSAGLKLHSARFERIEALSMAFRAAWRAGAPFARTLGGLRFALRDGRLIVARERARRAVRLSEKAAIDAAQLGNPASPP